jgi:VIT1/CCC1 family predicted Fe2+/Mn2+ transporter
MAPFLTANEVAVKVAEAAADAQEAEETRRMLELRELDQAVQAIRPQIEAYLQTAHGKEELKAVVREMHRLREQHKQAHPAAAEEARLLELAKKEAGDNGTPAERLLHELEKKEKVRAIFEVFDGENLTNYESVFLDSFSSTDLCLFSVFSLSSCVYYFVPSIFS